MEGSRRNFNDIVAKPLTKVTKEDWFEWVKIYLISKDLWEVTSSSSERPGENAVEEFARWRRDNAAALHVIRISCGSDNLPLIREASEAKVAWDILSRTDNAPSPSPSSSPPSPPPRPQGQRRMIISDGGVEELAMILRNALSPPSSPPSTPPPHTQGAEELEMGILYKAISEDNWSDAKKFIDAHPRSLDPELAETTGETPLHVAAMLGHVGIVEELVKLVSPEYLETFNSSNRTPLLNAAIYSGDIPIAKCLIKKNKKTLEIPAPEAKYWVPVAYAFRFGRNEMGRYLYSVTPLHVFQPQNGTRRGPTFLANCLVDGHFDIVLDLLQRCKELLFAVGDGGLSTIENLAHHLAFSPNKSQLPFWK